MDERGRIDLHTHSFFSDGELLVGEMLRRAEVLGYAALAITDHADASNLDQVLAQLVRFFREGMAGQHVAFIPGVELTHVPPVQIAPLARRAKRLGARLVVVHGETPVEPVQPGTNRAAIECPDVDILAHPGFLSEEEAALAAKSDIFLEITPRRGHGWTNGHVAQVARLAAARLVVNSDTHTPSDMLDQSRARAVALGAGLSQDEARLALVDHAEALVARALRPITQAV
jgi:histidinol phosphatase-like PHP family hydrolase